MTHFSRAAIVRALGPTVPGDPDTGSIRWARHGPRCASPVVFTTESLGLGAAGHLPEN